MTARDIVMAASGQSQKTPVVIVITGNAPGVHMYPWNPNTGWGTKYATPTSTSSGAKCAGLHPSGQALAVSSSSSTKPKYKVYPISASSGIGTPYANYVSDIPYSSSGTVDVKFNPSGTKLMALGKDNTSEAYGMCAYDFSLSGGLGSSYGSFIGIGYPTRLSWHPSGNAIAVSNDATTYSGGVNLAVVLWTGSNFGSSYNPASVGASATGSWTEFNKAGNVVALTSSSTSRIYMFPWTGSSIGTKFSNPSSLPAGTTYCCAFNSDDTAIAVGSANAPYIQVYAWNNSTGFGTKYSNPGAPLSVRCETIAFSKNDDFIFMGTYTNPPYVQSVNWSNSTGFGGSVSTPITAPSGRATDIIYGEI